MGQYRGLNNEIFVRTHLVQVWLSNRTNQQPFPQRSDFWLTATLRSSTQKEHVVLPTSKQPCVVYEQDPREYTVENHK